MKDPMKLGYDTYGRLNQIATPVGAFVYNRLAESDLLHEITRPNGVNTTWSYEPHRNPITEVANGSISTFGYTNNAIGNRTAMSRSGSAFTTPDTLNYQYNTRSEVTGANSTVNEAYTYAYAYDPIGNRLTANESGTPYAYTSNALNQYTQINTAAPTYDADGNMLTNGAWNYTWNGENRLIQAVNGTAKLQFAYDYMGRRIEKKVSDGEALTKHNRFVYNEYKQIEELDGTNATLRRYTWQPDALGLDVPLTLTDVTNDAVYTYTTDANKNVTDLQDATGATVAHYEYTPFGLQTAATGDYAQTNTFRFSSEVFDQETGLVYYNYRYYDPILGRWIKRDPIGEEGGLNKYNILVNNTLLHTDIRGLACCKGEDFDSATHCCCRGKVTSRESVLAEYFALLRAAHKWMETSPKWSYDNQCAEQAASYKSAMYDSSPAHIPPSHWALDVETRSQSPDGGAYDTHHVVKVRLECSDCLDMPNNYFDVYKGAFWNADYTKDDYLNVFPEDEMIKMFPYQPKGGMCKR